MQDNEVSLVVEDRRFALRLWAAQTQQSKMRSHVAIPLRRARRWKLFSVISWQKASETLRVLLLLHQTYRKGNHLVYESNTVNNVRTLTYLCATLSRGLSGDGSTFQ